MTSSVSIGSQSGTPCTSYTTINDPTRNIANSAIYSTCDDGPLFNASNDGSWIRFIGTGGTILPVTSPGLNHCGGYLAGWFNDTLPTIVGNVVNGTVCFDNYLSPCIYNVQISVINCGGFYIYLLPTLSMCNARYCTS
jgi:hypothetical protein